MRILIVGRRDTCRAPMMRAFLGSQLKTLGIEAEVESAGLTPNGSRMPASDHAQKVMGEMGFDLSQHSSLIASYLPLDDYDDIVALDQDLMDKLVEEGVEPVRIRVLCHEFDGDADPWSWDLEDYRECACILQEEARFFANQLAREEERLNGPTQIMPE